MVLALLVAVAAAAIGLSQTAVANGPPGSTDEYQIKAAFLYKFCLYVEWPAQALPNRNSPLILGIVGPDLLADNLAAVVKGRTIDGRPLEVRRIDPDSDSMESVHLLFLGRYRRPAKLIGPRQAVLIVTEAPEGFRYGSGINLVMDGNRIRFDIDLESIRQRGLHLSAQLLKAARRVEGEMH